MSIRTRHLVAYPALFFLRQVHQNAFGGRAPPGAAGGAYSAPADPVARLKGRGGPAAGEKRRERGKHGEGPPMSLLKSVDVPELTAA